MEKILNALMVFLRTKEQRLGFVVFLASLVVLILFGLLHHKMDCYSCDLEDFLPHRRTPFFYDVFFWVAVFGVLMSLFGHKIRPLLSWVRQDDEVKKSPSVLYFKDTKSAFEYAQKYMPQQIKEGQILLGMVDYAHIKEGFQVVTMELACGEDVIVKVIGLATDETKIKPRDLVYWSVADLASQEKEIIKRGVVLAIIKPELDIKNGWILKHRYKPKYDT